MNVVMGVKSTILKSSSLAIQCHWHEWTDYTPQVLKYVSWYEVCSFNQTLLKIIRNFLQHISQVKAYNATTFSVLWLLTHTNITHVQGELWEAYFLWSLIAGSNSGVFAVSKHHHAQSPRILQSAMPSGVPYFTSLAVSPNAVSHLCRCFITASLD